LSQEAATDRRSWGPGAAIAYDFRLARRARCAAIELRIADRYPCSPAVGRCVRITGAEGLEMEEQATHKLHKDRA